ncbi:monooxygenase [Daedalea quercina L-15889]|uniref:Monooxygenase n=1 Tax=Daedalea quercina L-15889 TaxID=1314783 RepID=A0A165M7S1_9APHY|nr:monooxygenase [Daedalea quercina L-15889]
MATTRLPVLVVGAGPTGLVLGLTLLQNGIQVRIIDKDPIRHPGHRGSGLQPRTLEIFRFLGVLDDVLSRALSMPLRCEYKLPGGIEMLSVSEVAPTEVPTPSIPYANVMLLGQYNTEAILRSHIERLGGTVEYGTELRRFENYSDRVEATLVRRDGESEETETVACHYLVGADGAKGVVRKQLGLSFLGETRTEGDVLLGLVEIQGLGTEYWHQWGDFTSSGVLLMPTEKPSYFSFILVGGGSYTDNPIPEKEALRQILRQRTDRSDLVFGEFEAVSAYRPNIRMVSKFSGGRVFVAGDAAHVHSPAGGQGLNTSVQDAFNLAWKLMLVVKGLASPSLLTTYGEERLPVIDAMLRRSTVLYDAMRNSEESAWKRGGDLRQLGVNYRWSSIVVDERTPKAEGPESVNPYGSGNDGTLRAGDRAPDASGLVPAHGSEANGPTSLFGMFRPTYHTVLLFGLPAQQVEYILIAAKKNPTGLVKTVVIHPKGTSGPKAVGQPDLTIVDGGGHAFAAYQVSPEKPTVVAVRPDGVVGAIVYGLGGFERYFRGIYSAIGDAL